MVKCPQHMTFRHLRRRSSIWFTTFFTFFLAALPVRAQEEWEQGRCATTIAVGGQDVPVATFQGIECLVANILSVAVTFIGFAAFIMVIYGAFLYLTSGGSSKGTEAGKQSLTYAIVGIIVALMAYWILSLIYDFTGVTGILRFNLGL